jgi:hypothetical protein
MLAGLTSGLGCLDFGVVLLHSGYPFYLAMAFWASTWEFLRLVVVQHVRVLCCASNKRSSNAYHSPHLYLITPSLVSLNEQRGTRDGRGQVKRKAWGRWVRSDRKDSRGVFVWQSDKEETLLSHVMNLSSSSKQLQTPATATQVQQGRNLPPEGVMTFTHMGETLPFRMQQDDQFWDGVLEFYNDVAKEAVDTAKEEARCACELVAARLSNNGERATSGDDFAGAADALQQHLENFILEHPNNRYFYHTSGTDSEHQGPVTFKALVALYQKEVIHLETYVWHKSQGTEWVKIKDHGSVQTCTIMVHQRTRD